tara:strand:+ start:622 stop:822 length:201 start_codon:yes stop_codon:yes gene_type:complete
MQFLTLSVNQPEKMIPILGKKEGIFGYSYHVVDFCENESSIDNVINELQSHSMTKWAYIEGNGNEQ